LLFIPDIRFGFVGGRIQPLLAAKAKLAPPATGLTPVVIRSPTIKLRLDKERHSDESTVG